MMSSRFFQRLGVIGLIYILGFSSATASEYKEGEDYQVIAGDGNNGHNKIIEFFSYSCPYCFRAQPVLKTVMTRLPTGFRYERVAVTLGKPDRVSYAYTHLLLKQFGLEEMWHTHIFFISQTPLREELEKYDKLWTMVNVRAFFMDNGIDSERFDAAVSFLDETQAIKNNDKLAGTFGVKGTPTFVIRGKYWVQGLPAGPNGQKKLEDLLLYLSTLDDSQDSPATDRQTNTRR